MDGHANVSPEPYLRDGLHAAEAARAVEANHFDIELILLAVDAASSPAALVPFSKGRPSNCRQHSLGPNALLLLQSAP